MTTGKIIALTIQTFVSICLCFLIFCLGLSQPFKEQAYFTFTAAVTIHSDFEVQENKVCHCFHCFSIYFPRSGGTGCHDLSYLNVEFSVSFFTLLFHLHQEAFQFLFAFYLQGGVICISEVADISASNLDSNLYFIQPGISRDIYSAQKLNKQGDNTQH